MHIGQTWTLLPPLDKDVLKLKGVIRGVASRFHKSIAFLACSTHSLAAVIGLPAGSPELLPCSPRMYSSITFRCRPRLGRGLVSGVGGGPVLADNCPAWVSRPQLFVIRMSGLLLYYQVQEGRMKYIKSRFLRKCIFKWLVVIEKVAKGKIVGLFRHHSGKKAR